MELHKIGIPFIVSRHTGDSQTEVDALDRAYAELLAAGKDMSLPDE